MGGGKRALIPSLAKHFPEKIGTYWEPFVGGGAVFFTMANRMDRAILSDTNEELIITYQTVKNDVNDLIEALRKHAAKHDDEGYYIRVRAMMPTTPLEIAGAVYLPEQNLLQRPVSCE